ncbi:MAG: hypothetical protein H6742_07800 [Alphaproteobacteria bacterium]|nr:hypothetical protein [Alphaproteobacteria bacterium]
MADTASDTAAGMPDFSKLSNDMYQQWEQAMTAWWDQVLDSPDFLKATGQNLSQVAHARKQYEQAVDEGLHKMHLPTRQDLVRVARIATLLEERLLQMEDRLLAMGDQLDVLEKETIQARVEAAEARLEMREKLAELQARLDAGEATAAPATATATPRRRSTAKKPARSSKTE